MLREFKKRLQEIGLTEKESAVYIAMLDQGAATADQASKRAGLNRSTTYVQIESLIEKGLVSSFKNGKKTFFAAESPNNLERLLETRTAELELQKANVASFVPDLMKLYATSGSRPVVRLFEGKEGLTSMRSEILSSNEKEIYVVASIDKLREVYNGTELKDFTDTREAKKMKAKVIYSLKTGEDFEPRKYQVFKRTDNKDIFFECDVYIYGDTVSFASIGTRIFGLTVTDSNIASTLRQMHEKVWETL